MKTVCELRIVVTQSDAALVRLSLVTPGVAHDVSVNRDRALTTRDLIAQGVQPQLRCPCPTGSEKVGKCVHWLSDEAQALCFLAGANSIFVGDTLLTTRNPDAEHDRQLFERLGLSPLTSDG